MKRLSLQLPIRFITVICLLVVMGAIAVGCAPSVRPIGEQDPKIFSVMLGKDPVSLDPMMAQDPETQQIVKALFDGLVEYDPTTLKPRPAVAKSWKSDENAQVWTFHLKKNVKYNVANATDAYAKRDHVTAGDFVFAWNRVASRDNASPLFYLMEPILGFEEVRSRKAEELEGVQALDEYTLQVTLRYPMADFDKLVGHVAFSPVKERNVEMSPIDFAERPIGNGPFEFSEWRHGVELIIDRFDRYYGKPPKLDRVRFAMYDDEEIAYEDFLQGALDDTQIPLGRLSELQQNEEYGKLIHSEPMLGMVYYGFNHAVAPFGNNVRLRRAFSNSINGKKLALLKDGFVTPASGIVPSAISGASEKAWPYPFNGTAARSQLAAAGFPQGRTLGAVRLGFNRESGHQRVVDNSASQLAAAGIKVALQPARFASYRENLELGKYPVFLSGWIADYPSPDAVLAPLFEPRDEKGLVGSQNLTRFRDAEVARMLKLARQTTDEAAREALYQEIEEKIADSVPLVPLYELRTRRVVQPWVVGYKRTAFDDTPLELVDIKREQIPAEGEGHGADNVQAEAGGH